MTAAKILSVLSLTALLAGCAHYDGLATQRADKTYVVLVPLLGGNEPQDVVAHAAYELCRANHQTGYALELPTKRSDVKPESMETVINCKGPIDPAQDAKYGKTKLDLRTTDHALTSGFKYQFVFVPK